MTKDGIPVRVWCWPGNNDQQVLAEVKDDMRHWRLGRVIIVVDHDFSRADNLASQSSRSGQRAARVDHGQEDHPNGGRDSL